LGQAWCNGFEQVLFPFPIYSIKEQIAFPGKIPPCDLFFSPHYNIPLLPIRAKKRIVTIHDVFHLAFASTLRLDQRLYAKFVIHQAIRKSDLVLTDSHFSRDEICKYTIGLKNEIHPIYCGVNSDIFRREENRAQIEKVIHDFSLPSNYFLFVGNLKAHKNLKGLLLALKELSSDVSLVVLGKSQGMNYVDTGESIYRQFPELAGRVFWFSSVTNKDLPIFYQLAQALVFPSYYEGFGLPPLEAMSCGCPVITSNRASLPEVCGAAPIYISPARPEEIALAMKKVMMDLEFRQKMVEEGYKNREKFTWKIAAERHSELFENLCL
jgi:glycosyltransferase involved in cell wall biosynthesis